MEAPIEPAAIISAVALCQGDTEVCRYPVPIDLTKGGETRVITLDRMMSWPAGKVLQCAAPENLS